MNMAHCCLLALGIIILYHEIISTHSAASTYDCKTISVKGVVSYPHLNGLYEKVYECYTYPVYQLRGADVVLFYKITASKWVIGRRRSENCDNMVEEEQVTGEGNKLIPYMIEANWAEITDAGSNENENVAVECDDVYWSMVCSTLRFPMVESRCYNATTAIEVQAVQVISFPKEENEKYCFQEQRCLFYDQCEVEGFLCRKNLSAEDYDFKMAEINCNGRHEKCHSFLVQPLLHIDCDLPTTFPCDAKPTVRSGIVVEYKCRRSRTYKAPSDPVDETLPGVPIQRPLCTTPVSSNPVQKKNDDDEDKDKDTLIKYVAPAAGVLFAVIIIAVIVVTILRRRNKRNRPAVISQKRPPATNRTYENIPAQGAKRPNHRPDIAKKTDKSRQPQKPEQPIADPAVLGGEAGLKPVGYKSASDVFTVVVLDKGDASSSRSSPAGRARNGRVPNNVRPTSEYGYSNSPRDSPRSGYGSWARQGRSDNGPGLYGAARDNGHPRNVRKSAGPTQATHPNLKLPRVNNITRK